MFYTLLSVVIFSVSYLLIPSQVYHHQLDSSSNLALALFSSHVNVVSSLPFGETTALFSTIFDYFSLFFTSFIINLACTQRYSV